VIQVDGSGARPLLDSVGTANVEGAREATRYLIDRGHRRIAFAGRIGRRIPSFEDRRRGYRDAMAAIGVEPVEIDVLTESTSVPSLQPTPTYTAIVAGNDYDAGIMLRRHQAMGLRVPDDISIIGFDDTTHASQAIPPLTTMRIDMLAMGRLAVEALQFRWRWPEAAPFMTAIQPVLVERESVRALDGVGDSMGAGNGRTSHTGSVPDAPGA
jgi:LacI family transcriptional regulator